MRILSLSLMLAGMALALPPPQAQARVPDEISVSADPPAWDVPHVVTSTILPSTAGLAVQNGADLHTFASFIFNQCISPSLYRDQGPGEMRKPGVEDFYLRRQFYRTITVGSSGGPGLLQGQ